MSDAEWEAPHDAVEHGGTRVFWATGDTMPALLERVALLIEEHSTPEDVLHVTHSVVQKGWTVHPGRPASLWRMEAARPQYTELHFEYSAIVVLKHQRSDA